MPYLILIIRMLRKSMRLDAQLYVFDNLAD